MSEMILEVVQNFAEDNPITCFGVIVFAAVFLGFSLADMIVLLTGHPAFMVRTILHYLFQPVSTASALFSATYTAITVIPTAFVSTACLIASWPCEGYSVQACQVAPFPHGNFLCSVEGLALDLVLVATPILVIIALAMLGVRILFVGLSSFPEYVCRKMMYSSSMGLQLRSPLPASKKSSRVEKGCEGRITRGTALVATSSARGKSKYQRPCAAECRFQG